MVGAARTLKFFVNEAEDTGQLETGNSCGKTTPMIWAYVASTAGQKKNDRLTKDGQNIEDDGERSILTHHRLFFLQDVS